MMLLDIDIGQRQHLILNRRDGESTPATRSGQPVSSSSRFARGSQGHLHMGTLWNYIWLALIRRLG